MLGTLDAHARHKVESLAKRLKLDNFRVRVTNNRGFAVLIDNVRGEHRYPFGLLAMPGNAGLIR